MDENVNKANKKFSVLIVDDEKSNIFALTYMLEEEYTLYASKDGRLAVKAAEARLPDVILLDVLMPEMDGYAVLNALKASERTRRIPVIFVTGLEDGAETARLSALGAVDCIKKPFRPAEVKQKIRQYINVSANPTK